MKKSYLAWAIILLSGMFAGTLQADIMVRDKKANIIYQYSNGVMYKGRAGQNKKMFVYNNRGEIWSMDHKKLAFWKASENALYPGNGGRPMYVYADKGGHPGSKGAKAVIFIDGRKIYHGHGPGCELILYPDSPLPTPVALYLAHTITGGKAPANPGGKLKVDWKTVPFGYYLGPIGRSKIMLSLRGNKIYFNDQAKGTPAYTYTFKKATGVRIFRGSDTTGEPAFCMADNGNLYKGGKKTPENLVMSLDWFNCYAPGKSGQDAIGTLQYSGVNILIEGYTKPSNRPDFAGKKILLSSTLPNNNSNVAIGKRIFLIYLTQLDPEFKAYCSGQK